MTHYDRGRRVTDWRLVPARCFGGFRLVWERWVVTRAGWDLEGESYAPTVYPDVDSATRAVDEAAAAEHP